MNCRPVPRRLCPDLDLPDAHVYGCVARSSFYRYRHSQVKRSGGVVDSRAGIRAYRACNTHSSAQQCRGTMQLPEPFQVCSSKDAPPYVFSISSLATHFAHADARVFLI
jgi:hypothetical protein